LFWSRSQEKKQLYIIFKNAQETLGQLQFDESEKLIWLQSVVIQQYLLIFEFTHDIKFVNKLI
jgi:hypothetical protein